jgi:hypothetical protein
MSRGTVACRTIVSAWRLAVLVGVVSAALWVPVTASAHVPFIESAQRSDARGTRDVPYPQAQPIPSPTISRAIYGYLAPSTNFDAYTFTVPREVTTEVAVIVPKRVGLETFRPGLRIYAEGADTSLVVPDPGDQPRVAFYEPFSFASFWNGATATTTFKPNERYFVVVEPPATGRKTGAYVLTFSGAEQFSAGDWFATAAAMPTIWLGSWAGGPARPGAYVCGVVFVLLVGLAVWLWVWRRRRRKAKAAAVSNVGETPPAAEQLADGADATAEEGDAETGSGQGPPERR